MLNGAARSNVRFLDMYLGNDKSGMGFDGSNFQPTLFIDSFWRLPKFVWHPLVACCPDDSSSCAFAQLAESPCIDWHWKVMRRFLNGATFHPPSISPITPYHVVHTAVTNAPTKSMDLPGNSPVGKFIRRIGDISPTICGLFLSLLRVGQHCSASEISTPRSENSELSSVYQPKTS